MIARMAWNSGRRDYYTVVCIGSVASGQRKYYKNAYCIIHYGVAGYVEFIDKQLQKRLYIRIYSHIDANRCGCRIGAVFNCISDVFLLCRFASSVLGPSG